MWLQKSKWLSLRILSTTVYCFNEYKGVLGTTKSRYIMIPPHLPGFLFFFTRFFIIFFSIYVIFLSSVQLLDFEDIVLMYVSLWVTLNENHFIIKAALIKFYKIILFCLYLKKPIVNWINCILFHTYIQTQCLYSFKMWLEHHTPYTSFCLNTGI